MNTRDTAVRVCGVLRCAKMQHRTHTRITRFGRTAGLPVPVRNPTDWTPYESRTEFETADFLFKHNQMSAGDIDALLNIWAATLAPYNDHPPFLNHKDLYSTIDATPLGDVPWESFSLKYNGVLPKRDIPPRMSSEYDVWFRDPRELVHNLISNPDFHDEFDYSPLREFDVDENRHYLERGRSLLLLNLVELRHSSLRLTAASAALE